MRKNIFYFGKSLNDSFNWTVIDQRFLDLSSQLELATGQLREMLIRDLNGLNLESPDAISVLYRYAGAFFELSQENAVSYDLTIDQIAVFDAMMKQKLLILKESSFIAVANYFLMQISKEEGCSEDLAAYIAKELNEGHEATIYFFSLTMVIMAILLARQLYRIYRDNSLVVLTAMNNERIPPQAGYGGGLI